METSPGCRLHQTQRYLLIHSCYMHAWYIPTLLCHDRCLTYCHWSCPHASRLEQRPPSICLPLTNAQSCWVEIWHLWLGALSCPACVEGIAPLFDWNYPPGDYHHWPQKPQVFQAASQSYPTAGPVDAFPTGLWFDLGGGEGDQHGTHRCPFMEGWCGYSMPDNNCMVTLLPPDDTCLHDICTLDLDLAQKIWTLSMSNPIITKALQNMIDENANPGSPTLPKPIGGLRVAPCTFRIVNMSPRKLTTSWSPLSMNPPPGGMWLFLHSPSIPMGLLVARYVHLSSQICCGVCSVSVNQG